MWDYIKKILTGGDTKAEKAEKQSLFDSIPAGVITLKDLGELEDSSVAELTRVTSSSDSKNLIDEVNKRILAAHISGERTVDSIYFRGVLHKPLYAEWFVYHYRKAGFRVEVVGWEYPKIYW